MGLFLVPFLALGFPKNMGFRFPSSREHRFMSGLSDGVYAPDMIQGGNVTCDLRGIYIVGDSSLEAPSLSSSVVDNNEKKAYNTNTNDIVGTISVTGKYFDMICANRNEWKYASVLDGEKFDIFADPPDPSGTDEKKVSVIGCGVGGLAAAAALDLAASEIKVICPGLSASTTYYSTGVSFFPDPSIYTEEYLDALVPVEQKYGLDRAMMLTWFAEGEKALNFWEPRLGLRDWTMGTFKPRDYQNQTGNWLKVPKGDCLNCGPTLIELLSEGLTITTGTVSSVRRVADGRFRLDYGTGTTLSPVVIFATGGDGGKKYPNSVHGRGLTNLALETADALGMAQAGTESCYWLPHVRLPGDGGGYQAEWFSMTNCAPTCGQVSICDPYNARGLSMDNSSCAAEAQDFSLCDAEAQKWRGVITQQGLNPNIFDCNQVSYLKGVIDCKGSFKLGPDFSSVDQPGLYGSGTTASAFTGNTYISPGATIGLGLYTGMKVAETAVARAEAWKRGDEAPEASMVAPLFLAAVWLLLVAVVAHVAGSGLPRWRNLLWWTHYVLAFTAVLVVMLAILLAVREGGGATRQHRTVGYVAFGLMVGQLVGGSWLVWRYYSKASYPSLAGLAHRVSGVVVLVLVSLQYFSSRDLGTEYDEAGLEQGATVWTVLLSVLLLVAGYLWLRPREDGTQTILETFL